MERSDWDARISSATSVLLLVCVFMVGFGLVLPSPAESAEPAAGFRPMAAPAKPVRLVVPTLDIKAPVKSIEVNDRQVLDPPRNPRDVGWWQRSARPGAQRGQTVLTGHTVHTGGGVMDELGDLERGDVVKVVTPRGTMVYRTTRVVSLSRAQLAERAVDLFGQQRMRPRLVLITCDKWNGRHYERNIVVFARPLGVRTPAA